METCRVRRKRPGPRRETRVTTLRLFDVVFIETTQVNQFTNTVPTQVYQSVFIGDNAFGHAISLPVELRDGGVLDFGREHALAYRKDWALAA